MDVDVIPYACGCGSCRGWQVRIGGDLFPRVFTSERQAEILRGLLASGAPPEDLELLLNGVARGELADQVRRFAEHVAAHGSDA